MHRGGVRTLRYTWLQAKLSEEEAAAREARNIKAQLLPHTVDVPVVPPRPEPKPLTRPEPFSLRSEVGGHQASTGVKHGVDDVSGIMPHPAPSGESL